MFVITEFDCNYHLELCVSTTLFIICLPICLSICLLVCLCLSICLLVCLCLSLCLNPFCFCLSFCYSVCLCFNPFCFCLSICQLVVSVKIIFVLMLPPTQIKYALPWPGKCHNIVYLTFFQNFFHLFSSALPLFLNCKDTRMCSLLQTMSKPKKFFSHFLEIMKQQKCRKHDPHLLCSV